MLVVHQRWGWGPDGTLSSAGGQTAMTCSPTTGHCVATHLHLPATLPVAGPVLGGVVTAS